MGFFSFFTSATATDIFIKLLIALILSLIIGLERELIHKPAGIKTHTLICLSATLVMDLGMYMSEMYPDVDPTRLPAQILAGIGFVGAGTILREGLSVKGITTAASLLATTCIGLAVGAGFYEGGIYATLLTFFVLCLVSPFQNIFMRKGKVIQFSLISSNEHGILGKAQDVFENNDIDVLSIKQIHSHANQTVILKFMVKCKDSDVKETVIQELSKIEGINEVNITRMLSKHDSE